MLIWLMPLRYYGLIEAVETDPKCPCARRFKDVQEDLKNLKLLALWQGTEKSFIVWLEKMITGAGKYLQVSRDF